MPIGISWFIIEKSLCMDDIMCFRSLEFVINFPVKFNVSFGNLMYPLLSHDLFSVVHISESRLLFPVYT
jgi:hypothetical protein